MELLATAESWCQREGGETGEPAHLAIRATCVLPLAAIDTQSYGGKIRMVTKRGRNFPQYCLNPNSLSVDLLNRSFAPLRQIVVGDHQERISHVMVQLHNPLQPV
jgi:hypothetical protein